MLRILLQAGVSAGILFFSVGQAGVVLAGDYYTTVPFLPTVKIGPEGTGATPARTVYGKEYSHTNWASIFAGGGDPRFDNIDDHDAFGMPDFLQVVSWDGIAGPHDEIAPGTGGPNSGSTNAFDYNADIDFEFRDGQVDALANQGDFLFRQVIGNEEAGDPGSATLLFSLTADLDASSVPATGPITAKAHVHWEAPVGPGAGTGVGEGIWAEIEAPPAGPGVIGPGVNHHVVEDVDALEVWGPEPPSHGLGEPDPVDEGYLPDGTNTADADRFSLDGDATLAGGTSVFAWDIATKKVTPYIPHFAIVDAVEDLVLGEGIDYDMATRDLIDVDGTMVRDRGVIGEWDTTDELLFTIDPLDDPIFLDVTGAPMSGIPLHGGEIMHLVNTGGGSFSISFLFHGGHLWDTAFSPAAAFGYLYDDVDALEAVGTLTGETDIPTPEPTSLLLMLGGVAALASCRRR